MTNKSISEITNKITQALEFAEIVACKNSFQLFCFSVCGHAYNVPNPEERISSANKEQIVLYFLWLCVFNSNQKIAIIVEKHLDATELMYEILQIAKRFTWIDELILYKNQRLIKFDNGSTILTGIQYHTLKGQTLNHLAVEEKHPQLKELLSCFLPMMSYDASGRVFTI